MGIIALIPWSATAACCASTVARSSACRIRLPSPRASMTALLVISSFLAPACLTPRFLLAPEPRHQPNQAGAGDDEHHRPRDALRGPTIQVTSRPEQCGVHDE